MDSPPLLETAPELSYTRGTNMLDVSSMYTIVRRIHYPPPGPPATHIVTPIVFPGECISTLQSLNGLKSA